MYILYIYYIYIYIYIYILKPFFNVFHREMILTNLFFQNIQNIFVHINIYIYIYTFIYIYTYIYIYIEAVF